MSAQKSIHTQEVSWPVDGINVEGTLTRPASVVSCPAVVMVAGSGPTDRNWNSPLLPGTNGSAALLAKALTDAGFVTLRYDKRASGPHAKENSEQLKGKVSLKSHLDELVGAVNLVASRAEVESGQIFALANSEGCIHAINFQNQVEDPHFAGLVLTAPPARPVGAVARSQIADQLQSAPEGEALLDIYDQAIDDFIAGRPVNLDENLPEVMRNLILSLTNPYNQPFSRELWQLDPAALLAKISAPVLIVIGKKDIQVNWQTEGEIFESLATHHENITIAYPENANHDLKYEHKPRNELNPAEVAANYNAESSRLDPEAVQIIQSWLADRL